VRLLADGDRSEEDHCRLTCTDVVTGTPARTLAASFASANSCPRLPTYRSTTTCPDLTITRAYLTTLQVA